MYFVGGNYKRNTHVKELKHAGFTHLVVKIYKNTKKT